MPYHDAGIPRRISYLIDPDGVIAAAYDLEGADLGEHSAQVLADIAARS
jgi:peroxiredoxin